MSGGALFSIADEEQTARVPAEQESTQHGLEGYATTEQNVADDGADLNLDFASEADRDGNRFSIADEGRDGFLGERQEQEVSAILAGKKLNRPVLFPKIPSVLEALGVSNRPLALTSAVVWKAIDKHHMTEAEIIAALDGLSAPVMAFDSATANNSVVFIVDVPNGPKAVVAIHYDKKVGTISIAEIASVHPRSSAGHIHDWMIGGLTRYVNKLKAGPWAIAAGLQLPLAAPKNRQGAKAPRRRTTLEGDAEDARFSIADEGREDRTPVATLTGNELGAWKDMRELGAKVYDWYREHLVEPGKPAVNKETGWSIRFNETGANKVSGRKGDVLMRIVPALREIIEQGRVIGTETDNRAREAVRAVHKIGARVVLDGQPRDVVVTIRETRDGHFHYDLSRDMSGGALFSIADGEQTAGMPKAETGHGKEGYAATAQNVADDGADLNLDFASEADGDGDRFSFAGERAKTVDNAAFGRAKMMERAGDSREDIFEETGFFKGPDGKWRFEISDADARLRPGAATGGANGFPVALGAALDHPSLYSAYPGLRALRVRLTLDPSQKDGSGEYNYRDGIINVTAPDRTTMLSILLHEVAHAIQHIEGFAFGGALSMGELYEGRLVEAARAKLDRLVKQWEENAEDMTGSLDLDRRIQEAQQLLTRAAQYEYYRHIAGEVEARNVQHRWEIDTSTDPNVKTFGKDVPWWTQDIPEDQVIMVRAPLHGGAFNPLSAGMRDADASGLSIEDERFSVSPEQSAAWRSHVTALRNRTAKVDTAPVVLRSPVLASIIGGKGRVNLSTARYARIASDHPDIPAAVWNLLPQMLSNPRFVFTRADGNHNAILIGKLSNGSHMVVSIRGDGEILTVTPMDASSDETADERLARVISSALSRPGKFYAVSKGALDEVLRLTGANSRDLPSSRTGMPHQGRRAKVLFRDDVVNRGSTATAPASGLTADALRSNLHGAGFGDIVQAMLDAGKLVIHGAQSTLPVQPPAGKRAQGLTDRSGTIHLVAGNLTPATARAVLLHEVFHAGTRTLLGEKRWNNLLDNVNGILRAQDRKLDSERTPWWRDAMRSINAARVPESMRAEELAAYAIEHREKAPAGLMVSVDNLVGVVKDFVFRKFGVQLGAVTPGQLRALAVAALRSGLSDGVTRSMFSSGPFTPSFKGFTNDPEGAIRKLMQEKRGEVADAFIHPELGPIAFVYGHAKMGLAHIAARRGADFLSSIPNILRDGKLVRDPKLPRVFLARTAKPNEIAVIRLDFDNKEKTWLVTAFHDNEDGAKVWDEAVGRSKTSDTASVPAQVPGKDGVVFSERADNQNPTIGNDNEQDGAFSLSLDDLPTPTQQTRRLKRRISQMLDDAMKGVGSGKTNISLLGTVPLRPLLEELTDGVPAAKAYLRVKQAMDTLPDCLRLA